MERGPSGDQYVYDFEPGSRAVPAVDWLAEVLNHRAIIGAFPWKYEGLESCPRWIIAFFDVGDMTVSEFAEAVAEHPA